VLNAGRNMSASQARRKTRRPRNSGRIASRTIGSIRSRHGRLYSFVSERRLCRRHACHYRPLRLTLRRRSSRQWPLQRLRFVHRNRLMMA
jgi:hypothetical protein